MQKRTIHPLICIRKKWIIPLILIINLIGFTYSNAQSPNIAWQKGYFAPINPITNASQTKQNSGEEWDESISQFMENGAQTGYVCAGYNTFLNTFRASNSCGIPQIKLSADDDFETTARLNGFEPAQINRIDLHGNLIWYKNFGNMDGDFFRVKQVGYNGGLHASVGILAAGETESFDNGGTIPLYYNPTSSSSNILTCHAKELAYLTKTDNNGNLIWQACYGPDLFTSAIGINEITSAKFYDFTEDANGDIFAIGYCKTNSYSANIWNSKQLQFITTLPEVPFIVKINGLNGQMIWKQTLTNINKTKGTGTGPNGGDKIFNADGEGIFVANNGKFYIYGYQYQYELHEQGSNEKSDNKIFIIEATDNGSSFTLNTSNQLFYGNTSGDIFGNPYEPNNSFCYLPNVGSGSGSFALSFLKSINPLSDIDLIVGTLSNLSNYTLDNIASASKGGQVSTADLRVNMTSTSDGGLAIASCIQNPSFAIGRLCNQIYQPDPSDHNRGIVLQCLTNPVYKVSQDGCNYWDKDVKVWKTNPILTGQHPTIKWDKTFQGVSAPLGCFPDNFKNEVCIFGIAEAEDGGVTVAGKISDNFDDNYVAKIYGDCGLPQSVVNPSGTAYSAPFNQPINDLISNFNAFADMNVIGSIIIHSGVTLHVGMGATIHFADSRKVGVSTNIIVEPGGKLMIDPGCKLTGLASCNNVWDGIILKGNCTQAQLISGLGSSMISPNQGLVYLRGCTIENARVAIKVYDPSDYYGAGHCGGAGGIVNADGVTFSNNYRAVEYMSYHNPQVNGNEPPNKGCIQYSTFSIDNNYNYDAGEFSEFISMWDIVGLKLHGNTYSNNTLYNNATSVEIPSNLSAKGIYSIDATYYVDNKLTTRSQFNNLDYGILAQNNNANKFVYVRNTDFNSNYNGVELDVTSGSTIQQNNFNLGTLPYTSSVFPWFVSGLGFVKSNQFNYNYNTFQKVPCTNCNGINQMVGTWYSNTSQTSLAENKCEKNDYLNIPYANLANEVNREINTKNNRCGLNFLCNANINNKFDFSVCQNGYTTNFDGIRDFQGYYNKPNKTISAGDHFSVPTSYSSEHQWLNHSYNPIIYYYYYTNELPASNNITNNMVIPLMANDPPTCVTPPTKAIGSVFSATEMAARVADFNYYKTQNKYYVNLLNSLIDDGNTVSLTDAVAHTLTTEVSSRRLQLLSQSPYLSTDVLFELVNQRDVFGDAILFEIIMANPDACHRQDFIDQLQAMVNENRFSQWMLDEITDNRFQTTYRTTLSMYASSFADNMFGTYREAISSIELDSIGFDHNLYRLWLTMLEDQEADYMLAEEYFEDGNIETVNAIIDSIPIKYSFENELIQTSYDDFKSWMNLRITWYNQGQSINALSAESREALFAFADTHNSLAGNKAKNVVNFFYNGTYKTLPQFPESEENMMRKREILKTVKHDAPTTCKYVSVYPNPATSYIAFEYKLPCIKGTATLEIFNAFGVSIFKQEIPSNPAVKIVDTQNFAAGTYFYKMICNGQVVGNNTFVIQK